MKVTAHGRPLIFLLLLLLLLLLFFFLVEVIIRTIMSEPRMYLAPLNTIIASRSFRSSNITVSVETILSGDLRGRLNDGHNISHDATAFTSRIGVIPVIDYPPS